jgi:hypothetical protein
MEGVIMARLTMLGAAVVGVLAGAAGATPPFELIVPRSVTFHSHAVNYGFANNVWGWLGATGGALTQAQIENATVIHGLRSTDLPASEFELESQDFVEARDLPLGRWQGVGGVETEPIYEALLSPVERAGRLHQRSLIIVGRVVQGAAGSGELQTDVLIGTQRLTYYTHVEVVYAPEETIIVINEAQRVGSLSYICPCDFDDSAVVNSQDFFEYLNCYFTPGCSRADFNRDGAVNSQDFFDFLACFFAPPAAC